MADFKSKTWHSGKSLEQMANEIMAAAMDTAPCEMIPYNGAGIDGMGLEKGE